MNVYCEPPWPWFAGWSGQSAYAIPSAIPLPLAESPPNSSVAKPTFPDGPYLSVESYELGYEQSPRLGSVKPLPVRSDAAPADVVTAGTSAHWVCTWSW